MLVVKVVGVHEYGYVVDVDGVSGAGHGVFVCPCVYEGGVFAAVVSAVFAGEAFEFPVGVYELFEVVDGLGVFVVVFLLPVGVLGVVGPWWGFTGWH